MSFSGQNDRQGKKLTGQQAFLAGYCPFNDEVRGILHKTRELYCKCYNSYTIYVLVCNSMNLSYLSPLHLKFYQFCDVDKG